jgi:DNA-directed RNA polymerase specialized sigma24 family protein
VFTGRRRELFRRSGPRSAVDEDFAQFVAERSAPLLRTAWLLTGDAARAEELLLTALSAAWAKWAWILGGGPPEEYVRRVLVTRYLSRRRRFEAPTSGSCHAAPAAVGRSTTGAGDNRCGRVGRSERESRLAG